MESMVQSARALKLSYKETIQGFSSSDLEILGIAAQSSAAALLE